MVEVYNRRQSVDEMFTIAQDINGKIYVKCNDCNKTMIGTLNYKRGRRTFNYRCPDCDKKTSITL